jgi:protein involved in polysaccharide export with SLBB domain
MTPSPTVSARTTPVKRLFPTPATCIFVLSLSLLARTGSAQENSKPTNASRSDAATKSEETSESSTQISRASGTYKLNPSDLIAVNVYQEPELCISSRLSDDGVVVLPLIGNVNLAGKTVKEATELITGLYGKDYLVSPMINLIVLELTKARFSALGQIGRPGTYEIPIQGKIALMEAIAMAGGYTRIASPSKITVKRGNEVFKVNGKDQASSSKKEVFWILPGDVITIGESIF